MIQNEKDLEDYICNNQEEFINVLKGIYGEEKDIKFLGRQVKIGDENIADLIYYYDLKPDDSVPFIPREYIIVELKYRKLEPKDLAQLSRYISCLREKLSTDESKYRDYEHMIYGLFVSFGLDNLMQDIAIYLEDKRIDFLSLKTNVVFSRENWCYKDEYIENLKLDKRIEDLYKKEGNK